MARIRSIKPELRTSLVVADWPRDVRYLWVLLWGYVDDHGYGVDDARLIKADCLPLDDDVTGAVIGEWLDLITKSGPLCRYVSGGKRYLHVPSWTEHQKPQHPKDSKIPRCPHHDLGQSRSDLHEDFMKPSGNPPENLTPEQGAGSREQGDGAGSAPQAAPAAKPRTKRGTRIPDDFVVTDDMKTWFQENCQGVDGPREHQKFMNYWRAKAGAGATKLDWPATWRNWMLSAAERFQPARASPGNVVALRDHQPRPSTADLRVADAMALAQRLSAEEESHDAG